MRLKAAARAPHLAPSASAGATNPTQHEALQRFFKCLLNHNELTESTGAAAGKLLTVRGRYTDAPASGVGHASANGDSQIDLVARGRTGDG